MIRARVVGKKLVKEGPYGTLIYTIKQMKVSDSSPASGGFLGWFCQKRPGLWGQGWCLFSEPEPQPQPFRLAGEGVAEAAAGDGQKGGWGRRLLHPRA